MMRIISGSKRGKKLLSLEGDNTRPTLERVKQSFFNAIHVFGNRSSIHCQTKFLLDKVRSH